MLIEIDESVLVDALTALHMAPEEYMKQEDFNGCFHEWVQGEKDAVYENMECDLDGHDQKMKESLQQDDRLEEYENQEMFMKDYVKLMLKYCPESLSVSIKIIER